ncbi:hypothetical protein B296_00051892 [Ensete ventricosum]|uniref:Vesicle-fusing ATPase n=1 Tax=Ensete ventricosum TaxID=4639 RepID=A0A426YEN5_ENSVE|nr:hypothetical protein B296_00051892 [Ensete ventricosum]
MLVIGTTSEVGFLESLGICDAFSVTYHVPRLNRDDAKKVSNTPTDMFKVVPSLIFGGVQKARVVFPRNHLLQWYF